MRIGWPAFEAEKYLESRVKIHGFLDPDLAFP